MRDERTFAAGFEDVLVVEFAPNRLNRPKKPPPWLFPFPPFVEEEEGAATLALVEAMVEP